MKSETHFIDNPMDLRFVFRILKKRIISILLFTGMITGAIFFYKLMQNPVYNVEVRLITPVLSHNDLIPLYTSVPVIFNQKDRIEANSVREIKGDFDLNKNLFEVISYHTSGENLYSFRLNIYEEEKIDTLIKNFVGFLNHNSYISELKQDYLKEIDQMRTLIKNELETIQHYEGTVGYDPVAVLELKKELNELSEKENKLKKEVFNPVFGNNFYISYEENKPNLLNISLSAAFLSFMIALFAFMYIESIRQKPAN